MHLLFIKILNTDYKEEVYTALKQADIRNAFVMEWLNLDKAQAQHPAFCSTFFSTDGKREDAMIISAMVAGQTEIDTLIRALKEADIPRGKENILRVLSWPVDVLLDI